MMVGPSRIDTLAAGGSAGIAAVRPRGSPRSAPGAAAHAGRTARVAPLGAEAGERGHAGLAAALARQRAGAGGMLLTALIHHMGGAATSAWRGMYVDTTA